MRLRAIDPPLPPAIIDALGECNIKTDADLMFCGTAIEIYAKIAPCDFSLAELGRCIKQVTRAASASVEQGSELFEKEEVLAGKHGPVECTSGVPELDSVLEELGSHHVTEISGEHGSGKSVSILIFSGYRDSLRLAAVGIANRPPAFGHKSWFERAMDRYNRRLYCRQDTSHCALMSRFSK